jgi:hypothetical protein
MRTHQDAKAMAKSLKDSMTRRKVSLSHGECLEIVAKQFGVADWNTLAARLPATPTAHDTAFCSFCNKSQHEVRGLVEGGCRARHKTSEPCVFICDECISFCAEVLADRIGGSSKPS